jgi:predicted aldo/keto reductase-like oxidoreductase
MKDLHERLEKLRTDAEDCALISKLATDKMKRETFARLADHLRQLANDAAAAIAEKDQTRPT